MIGANGAGKSTLFKMLIDEYEDTNDPVAAPDSGTIRLGSTVQLGYVDQNRTLDPEKTVYDEITGGVDHLEVGGREMHGRSYVASFNFKGPDQQKLVSNLSGGERNRVHLAKVLKEGANVLLLDEPTNDLDIDTLRALEDAIEAYAGCAVIVSHDRWFLDRVATHIVAFEGESQVRWFEGNFTDYAEYRKREHGVDAMRPHRIKYTPVTRGGLRVVVAFLQTGRVVSAACPSTITNLPPVSPPKQVNSCSPCASDSLPKTLHRPCSKPKATARPTNC